MKDLIYRIKGFSEFRVGVYKMSKYIIVKILKKIKEKMFLKVREKWYIIYMERKKRFKYFVIFC